MATLSVGGTTVFDGAVLQSGVSSTHNIKTPSSGDILQMHHIAKAAGVDVIQSTSQNSLMTNAPFTLMTSQFDTTAEASTIWKITGSCHVNSQNTNSNGSVFCYVTYDANAGTPTWARVSSASANSNEGKYIAYESDTDVYQYVSVVHFVTLTVSKPYTKIGFAFHSTEASDTTNWNHNTGGGAYGEALQLKI